MSEPFLRPSSEVFTNPLAVQELNSNPETPVNATTTPVALGGVGQTWTTATAAPGETAQVVVTGVQTYVNLGTGAAQLNAVGSGLIIESVQLLNSSTQQVIPDLAKTVSLGLDSIDYTSSTPVDTNQLVASGNATERVTIAQASGGIGVATPFTFYAHGGSGDDTIVGSYVNDFIRGGLGDDVLRGRAGNDLIRGGGGSDTISLGSEAGVSDTLYYTIDQIQQNDRDIVTDFQSGIDKVAVQTGITSSLSSDGKTITFTLSGLTTRLFNQSGTFINTDIVFIS